MSRENEYLTSNRHIRYPFADDSVITRSGNAISDDLALIVCGCFVDAMVQCKHSALIIPTISGISVGSNTLRFMLSAEGRSSVPLVCTTSDNVYPVIRGSTDWCWYTFVISSAGIREFEENKDSIGNISSSVLTFNSRCVSIPQPGVDSLLIYGGKRERGSTGKRLTQQEALLKGPDVIIRGAVKLEPGYNFDITSSGTEVTFNAVPGAGLGVTPCPEDDHSEKICNSGLWCENGHVRLFNDTCYDLQPSRTDPSKGYLSMHVKCKACCTCDMYSSIVNNRLIPLKNEILSDKNILYQTLNDYEVYVARWNKRVSSALPEDIIVTMTAIPLDAAATDLVKGAKVSGKMDRCGYSVTIKNNSFVDVRIVIERFSVNGTAFQANINYMDGETPVVRPVSIPGSVPIIVDLGPGKSAMLNYFVRLDKYVKTDEQIGFITNMTIAAYHNEVLVTRKNEVLSV